MKKLNHKLFWMVAGVLLLILGCNMQKEVEIDIPPYERQLVVECYLQPDKPFRLLLTESIGFFEGADTPIVVGAEVIISHDNVHDTLLPGLNLEPQGFKIHNWFSHADVPRDYSTTYHLQIKHPDGRIITADTRVMPRVDMGELDLSYNADSLAALTMHWQDIPDQENYYLVTLHKGTVYHGDPNRDSPLEFDFTLDDRIGDGETFTIATLFNYESGDTLITTLYHIDKNYWSYANSLDDAMSSNGNPFAQPGVIHSNVTGGIGIFTGFDYDRDTIIVP